MAKVFISRALSVESTFLARVGGAGHDVIGESLLQIDPVPFATVPETDWVFFYSKNAVIHYFAGVGEPPPSCKYGAYGTGTAAYLQREYGIQANFIGSAKPKATAEALATVAAGQRILFPRARHSRHSLYKYLRYKTTVQELSVYDNRVRESFELPFCEVLVFTSPLNAQAYYGHYVSRSRQTIVSIGRTTAQELRRLGIRGVHIARQPAEAALAELVLSLL